MWHKWGRVTANGRSGLTMGNAGGEHRIVSSRKQQRTAGPSTRVKPSVGTTSCGEKIRAAMRPPTQNYSDLGSGDAFVLQRSDDHAAVLRLAFRGVVRSYLIGGAHRSRSQHVGQWNFALLFQDIDDVTRALLAQFLVQGRRAYLRRISLYLDHVALNRLGLLAQGKQLRHVLLVNFHLAIGEEHLHFIPDVVVAHLAKALVDGGNGSLLLGDLRCVLRLLRLRRLDLGFLLLELCLLLCDLLLLRLRLLFHRSYAGLDVSGSLERLAIELDSVGYHLVLGVVVPFHLHRQSGNKSGDAHLLLAGVEDSRDILDVGVLIEDDYDVSRGRLYRHGIAAASIDDSLDLGFLRGSGGT